VRFSEQRWDAFGGSPSESDAARFGTAGVAISATKPGLSSSDAVPAGACAGGMTA
jgi:hypothetical protein